MQNCINEEFHECFFLSFPSSYGREYADPYLGHGIGPVAGYGVRKLSRLRGDVLLRFHLTGVPLNRARTSPTAAAVWLFYGKRIARSPLLRHK